MAADIIATCVFFGILLFIVVYRLWLFWYNNFRITKCPYNKKIKCSAKIGCEHCFYHHYNGKGHTK